MRATLRNAAVAACVFAMLACANLQAEGTQMTSPPTLNIAPTGYITVALGTTKQFSAFLGTNTSQADTNVTWSVEPRDEYRNGKH